MYKKSPAETYFPGFHLNGINLPKGFIDKSYPDDICPSFRHLTSGLEFWIQTSDNGGLKSPYNRKYRVQWGEDAKGYSFIIKTSDIYDEILDVINLIFKAVDSAKEDIENRIKLNLLPGHISRLIHADYYSQNQLYGMLGEEDGISQIKNVLQVQDTSESAYVGFVRAVRQELKNWFDADRPNK